MRAIEQATRFRRDYKRELKSNPKLDAVLLPVLDLRVADADLPLRLNDHGLGGEWIGYRDCHLKPDLILIYEKLEGVLRLVRLGSHSELFT